MNTTFFGEMLQTIAERGRSLLDRRGRSNAEKRSAGIIELSEQLLSGRGEASGVALAGEILAHYAELTSGPRIAFFEALAQDFGPDHARLDAAVDRSALFAHLLDLNAGLCGAAFATEGDQVLLVSERSTLDLDLSEVLELIERVTTYTDEHDDVLVARFGGRAGG